MQIQTEILSGLLVLKDVGKQSFITRPENDRVVRYVGVLLFGAEVPNKQAVGVMGFINLAISPLAFVCLR